MCILKLLKCVIYVDELIKIPIIYAGGSLDTDATPSEKSKMHSVKDYLMLTFANHTIHDKVSLQKTKEDLKRGSGMKTL